jgi:hypothetical protein
VPSAAARAMALIVVLNIASSIGGRAGLPFAMVLRW